MCYSLFLYAIMCVCVGRSALVMTDCQICRHMRRRKRPACQLSQHTHTHTVHARIHNLATHVTSPLSLTHTLTADAPPTLAAQTDSCCAIGVRPKVIPNITSCLLRASSPAGGWSGPKLELQVILIDFSTVTLYTYL